MIKPPDNVMPEIVLRMMSRAVHSTGLTNNSSGAIRPLTARLVRLTEAELTVREARLAMKSLQPSRKPAAMPRSTPTRWGSVRDRDAFGQWRRRVGRRAVAVTKAAGPAVRTPFRRLPAGEQIGIGLVHLHAQRVAVRLGVTALTPQRHRQVTARAQRDGHQQIDLGEQFDVVAGSSGTGLHEVALVVGHQPGHLEEVDDIVDVELGQSELGDRAGEIGVAVEVVGGTAQQLIDIRIASRTEEIVTA